MSGFGQALAALKTGSRVRRDAWADGCFAVLVPGSVFPIEAGRPLGDAAPHLVGRYARYAPHIDMCVFSGGEPQLSPRVWDSTDLLADDWIVVEA